MTAGTAPAPIQIPKRSPRRAIEASSGHGQRRQATTLAMTALVVLVTLVVMELYALHDTTDDVHEWSFWMIHLVFPSQHVTWAKLAGLVLGLVLTTSYLLSSQSQLTTAEEMLIRSANALMTPLGRNELKPMANDSNAPTPTGKTMAAWIASRSPSPTDKGGHYRENDELPQLKIRDECKAHATSDDSLDFEAVNRAQPLAFESEYFRGHVLFMVKDSTKSSGETRTGNWDHLFTKRKRMLWVQVQGRFKRPLPPRAVMYLATELPEPDGFQVAFLRRQLVNLLITLVKKFVPMAHIAFGQEASKEGESELPHAAFPFYQTVDEFVVTEEGDNLPTFGQEVFGESPEGKKARFATPVGMEPVVRTDAVYSFQLYTMYSDLAQWKIINIPGMPDMDLTRFCGSQPIRLAMYLMKTPALHPGILCDVPHKIKDKGYIFCFSMHHKPTDEDKQLTAIDGETPTTCVFFPTPSNPLSPLQNLPLRWRSVSCDQPDPILRQQTREAEVVSSNQLEVSTVKNKPQPRIRASSSVRNMTSVERAVELDKWTFSLPVWIERVDPAAGNRKVAYLFVVEEKQAACPTRRCVVRSAQTVKNALLMLDAAEMTPHTLARQFKKLVCESREFLYESICRETEELVHALYGIAAIPPNDATEIEKDKKAMLFNCLMSESQLPCIRSFHDIGVQLSKAKRDQMDIIFEKGVYRMPDPRFLRQEWLILTTTELHFFRSFSLKPSKTVPLAQVLGVRPVKDVPFFDVVPGITAATTTNLREDSREGTARSTNQWFCVEIHVLTEIITVFFDCDSDQALCLSSITQLTNLKAAGVSPGRLTLPRSIDGVTTPMCLNQRKRLPASREASSANPVAAAERLVACGARLYGCPRHEENVADIVAFLDAVDELCEIDIQAITRSPQADKVPGISSKGCEQWFSTNEDRIAFALNLFHGLFVHAWLLFGDMRTHAQWKKLKSMVYYAIGNPKNPGSQLRITLGDIEHTLLKGRYAYGDEHKNLVNAIRLPTFLMPSQRDFRTSFALQTNSAPSSPQILRVYHASALANELDEMCTVYLETGVIVDDVHHIIQLPQLCEWNLDDYFKSSPIIQPGSRAFFCLQKLLPLMHAQQHDRIQHVLLGASNEYQIQFSTRFWTQDLKLLQPERSVISPREQTAVAKVRAMDDMAVSSSMPQASETSDGIPRSKSTLEFFRSLF